jgi:hypothetical protein
MSKQVGRPPKFKTPEEMQEAIDAYYAECKERNAPLTMTGLSIALGFESRSSLVDYKKRDDAFSHTIKKARQEVERAVEERMLSSSGVVAGVIFNAKNNFGWRDRTEQDITSGGDAIAPLLVKFIDKEQDASTDN